MRVSAIVMAAGFSRRMGGRDKLLLPFRGGTVLGQTLAVLAATPLHERILVTTPARLAQLAVPEGFAVLLNGNPQRGQSESLRLGTRQASGDVYLYCMGDQPLLDRETLDGLLAHADGEHIVYPVADGRPCSPALFPAALREELLRQEGDAGGRAVRAAHPALCRAVAVADRTPLLDVDTWEDYQQVLRQA